MHTLIHYLLPAMTDRIRTTISLTPEAYEVYKRMAEAANLSVSRTMGDWLSDTADAAQMISIKMEEAKRAPMRVVREMRALVAGLEMSVIETQDEIRGRRVAGRTVAAPPGAVAVSPPSSNTGGKSPGNAKNTTSRTPK